LAANVSGDYNRKFQRSVIVARHASAVYALECESELGAYSMTSLSSLPQEYLSLEGWDYLPERYDPLPGQIGIFEYLPVVRDDGHPELFDTGRDLPGADEHAQRILWDLER